MRMTDVALNISADVFSNEKPLNINEEELAALLRSHQYRVPLLVYFPSRGSGDGDAYCFSEIKGVFHCRRCYNFWQETHKTLSICYEECCYVEEPVVHLSLTDAIKVITHISWDKVFATGDLISIFPLLKHALDETERKSILSFSDDVDENHEKVLLACIGGEMGVDRRFYPLGQYDKDGSFHEGGPEFKFGMRQLDANLYRRRAEEKFLHSHKKSIFVNVDRLPSHTLPFPVLPSTSFASSQSGDAKPLLSNLNVNSQSAATVTNEKTSNQAGIPSTEWIKRSRIKVFKKISQTNKEWEKLNDGLANKPRRIYNTKSQDKPFTPSIATLKSDENVSRKGAVSALSSPHFYTHREPVNSCVWNKTGRPMKKNKPSSLIAHAQSKMRSESGLVEGEKKKNSSSRQKFISVNDVDAGSSAPGVPAQWSKFSTLARLHDAKDKTRKVDLLANQGNKMYSNKYRRHGQKMVPLAYSATSLSALGIEGPDGSHDNIRRPWSADQVGKTHAYKNVDEDRRSLDGRLDSIENRRKMELIGRELKGPLNQRSQTWRTRSKNGQFVDSGHINGGKKNVGKELNKALYDVTKHAYLASTQTGASSTYGEEVDHDYDQTMADELSMKNSQASRSLYTNKPLKGNKIPKIYPGKSRYGQMSKTRLKHKSHKSSHYSIGGKHHASSHDSHHFFPSTGGFSTLNFTKSFMFSYFDMPQHVKEHNRNLREGNLIMEMENIEKEDSLTRQDSSLVHHHPSNESLIERIESTILFEDR